MATSRAVSRYDGSLRSWSELEAMHPWDTLVLGNGLSINIWEKFNYVSLYAEAKQRGFLSDQDARLFDGLGVTNFEHVLNSLSQSIQVGHALGLDRRAEEARHRSIQTALARAVHAVHIPWNPLPLGTLRSIHTELMARKHVFTTSYDLLLYWAMGCTDDFRDFLDFFWPGDASGDLLAFNEATHHFAGDDPRRRVYFLHGALHLVARSDGWTCKRHSQEGALLDQFGLPHYTDQGARPLVVTEATAADKRRSIADNDYLTYAWKQLEACGGPLVIFGHSLSPQDAHLVDALNKHVRPMAISIRDKGTEEENRQEQLRIAALLRTQDVEFFDASSHPLGARTLNVPVNPFLRRVPARLRF